MEELLPLCPPPFLASLCLHVSWVLPPDLHMHTFTYLPSLSLYPPSLNYFPSSLFFQIKITFFLRSHFMSVSVVSPMHQTSRKSIIISTVKTIRWQNYVWTEVEKTKNQNMVTCEKLWHTPYWYYWFPGTICVVLPGYVTSFYAAWDSSLDELAGHVHYKVTTEVFWGSSPYLTCCFNYTGCDWFWPSNLFDSNSGRCIP